MKEKNSEGAWTFITNHAVVLSIIAHVPMITARDLSLEVGITERAVRRIIAELESDGYLVKTKEGRRVRYSVSRTGPLRHRTHKDKAVGDLLKVLGFMGRQDGR